MDEMHLRIIVGIVCALIIGWRWGYRDGGGE